MSACNYYGCALFCTLSSSLRSPSLQEPWRSSSAFPERASNSRSNSTCIARNHAYSSFHLEFSPSKFQHVKLAVATSRRPALGAHYYILRSVPTEFCLLAHIPYSRQSNVLGSANRREDAFEAITMALREATGSEARCMDDACSGLSNFEGSTKKVQLIFTTRHRLFHCCSA